MSYEYISINCRNKIMTNHREVNFIILLDKEKHDDTQMYLLSNKSFNSLFSTVLSLLSSISLFSVEIDL